MSDGAEETERQASSSTGAAARFLGPRSTVTTRRLLPWFSAWSAASLICAALLLAPRPARAQCPPPVDPGSGLAAVLGQCSAWSCSVRYDPAFGYLPDEDPVSPWEGDLYPGTQVEIVNDRLLITGPNISQTPGLIVGATYSRPEPDIEDATSAIYLMQVRFNVHSVNSAIGPTEELASFGAYDGDKLAFFSLGLLSGARVAVNGEAYLDPAATYDPSYVMPWDWQQDTTYTMLVQRGQVMYLLVDGQPVMTRPYNTLYSFPPSFETPGFFGVISEQSIAEIESVQYCVCAPVAGNTDDDQDGYTVADGDCNDGDPTVHPGALEFPCDDIWFGTLFQPIPRRMTTSATCTTRPSTRSSSSGLATRTTGSTRRASRRAMPWWRSGR